MGSAIRREWWAVVGMNHWLSKLSFPTMYVLMPALQCVFLLAVVPETARSERAVGLVGFAVAPVAVIATSMTLSKERYLRTFEAISRPVPALSQMLLIRALINFAFCCSSCVVCLIAAAFVGRSISLGDVVLVLAAAWSGCVIGLLTGVAGLIINDVFFLPNLVVPLITLGSGAIAPWSMPVLPMTNAISGLQGATSIQGALVKEAAVTLVFFVMATLVARIAQDRASAGRFGN